MTNLRLDTSGPSLDSNRLWVVPDSVKGKHLRIVMLAVFLAYGWQPLCYGADRPRLAILTDIGGDPDDQQSMIRLMVYANEFEIEALT